MNGTYTVTVAAAEEPVTLAEAKEWVRLDTDITADDTLLTVLIASCTATLEKSYNTLFVERTLQGLYQGICANKFNPYPFLRVERFPVLAVSVVEVFSGGSFASVMSDTELVPNSGGFPQVNFYDTSTVPDTDTALPYRITFTAGYGTASAVPEDIKTAIKAYVAFLYENRADTEAVGRLGFPLETKAIMNGKYRIINTF